MSQVVKWVLDNFPVVLLSSYTFMEKQKKKVYFLRPQVLLSVGARVIEIMWWRSMWFVLWRVNIFGTVTVDSISINFYGLAYVSNWNFQNKFNHSARNLIMHSTKINFMPVNSVMRSSLQSNSKYIKFMEKSFKTVKNSWRINKTKKVKLYHWCCPIDN